LKGHRATASTMKVLPMAALLGASVRFSSMQPTSASPSKRRRRNRVERRVGRASQNGADQISGAGLAQRLRWSSASGFEPSRTAKRFEEQPARSPPFRPVPVTRVAFVAILVADCGRQASGSRSRAIDGRRKIASRARHHSFHRGESAGWACIWCHLAGDFATQMA
jgi:hypothetical protein